MFNKGTESKTNSQGLMSRQVLICFLKLLRDLSYTLRQMKHLDTLEGQLCQSDALLTIESFFLMLC